MTDRAAYTLAAAILVAGALVAGALTLRPVVGRYAVGDNGALLDTATGELLVLEAPWPPVTWHRGVAPIGTPPDDSEAP